MKYRTENEWNHFRFTEAYIAEVRAMSGIFRMELDNVIILPENSCNRDIREMRTNGLLLKISNAEITSFVAEGYKVYDADGKLLRQEPDRVIPKELYAQAFEELSGCMLHGIERSEQEYVISIDTEEATCQMRVAGAADVEEWDLFLNL